MRRPFLLLAAVLCAPLACAQSEHRSAPPTPAADPDPVQSTGQQILPRPPTAPFVVNLTGPAHVAPGTEIELKLVIDRTAADLPLKMKVNLPAGVTLVRGSLDEQLPPGAGPVERTLVVRVGSQMPAAPLEVTVDGGGEGFGAHATRRYRFGRPEPKLPQPGEANRPVRINGSDIGQPIPLGR